jgi:hypothetical protein
MDVETHKILGFTATREDVSDAQTSPSSSTRPSQRQGVEAVLGDGDQRRKKLLQQVQGAGREAHLFRVRKNASTKSRGCPSRAKVVRYIKEHGYKAWA